MAELEIGGVKIGGGKGMAVLMALGSAVGALYGGFEVYKDYMDMKAKLADLEPEAIQHQIDNAMVKLDEGVSYARDIKNDLRSDVIGVEKALGDVEARMREMETANRQMVREAQAYFDERTYAVGQSQTQMEERLNKKIRDALTNSLAEQ
jgi:hypothetical protein